VPDAAQFNLKLLRQFKLWMAAQKYHRRTQDGYKYTIQSFCAFLGNKSAVKVRYVDILEYLAAVSPSRTLSTIRSHLHILRVFYDFLDFGGLITEHSPRMVLMRAIRRKVPTVLSERQVFRLIAAARNCRDRLIAELLYATGCRPCELGRIKFEDIDFDGRKIRVIGKGKARFVLFGLPAKRAILAYLKGRKTGYLLDDGIPKQNGFICPAKKSWMLHWRTYSGPHQYIKHSHYIPVSRRASRQEARALLRKLTKNVDLSRPLTRTPKGTECVRDAVKWMAARARMPWITPSMLRHSFATHLLDHDAHLRTVQDLMGHCTLRSTEIYTHVSTAHLMKSYKRCHPRGR
jgi:integrase/recombinase XerC